MAQKNCEDTLSVYQYISFENIARKIHSFGPSFEVNPRSIKILDSPAEFHAQLIEHARKTTDRIFLSTLYVGQGDPERELIEAISENKEAKSIQFLIDEARGTRGKDKGESSLDILKPLTEKDGMDIHLYRHPFSKRGAWKWAPERVGEVAGVHHVKAFIFDDTAILSGANLNCTYLTNRQDRYMIVKDRAFTDHLWAILNTISHECPSASWHDESWTIGNANKDWIDPHVNGSRWINHVYRQLKEYLEPGLRGMKEDEKKREEDDSEDGHGPGGQTFITMSMQFHDVVNADSRLTNFLFSLPSPHIRISTAYFNLFYRYQETLLNRARQWWDYTQRWNLKKVQSDIGKESTIEILTASEAANSFYGAKGLSGWVTPLYESFAADFENKVDELASDSQNNDFDLKCMIHRYERPLKKWTYHGKGIWLDFKKRYGFKPFSVSMIGSSNYGARSVNRDTEMNFTVITRDEGLSKSLENEWNGLCQYKSAKNPSESTEDISTDSGTAIPWWLSTMSGVARQWM